MHQLSPFRQIERRRLGRAGYARLILASHDFHQAVAAAVARSALEPLSGSARRAMLCRDDLRALGLGSGGSDRRLGIGGDPDRMLGALYVAEGSMLGGRVIARQLDYMFGQSDDGRRYFRGEPGDSLRWRRLLERIAEADRVEGAADRMIVGALDAFGLFELCLEDRS